MLFLPLFIITIFKCIRNKIDIFIFGLKDDDTNAILSIIFADYPVVKILIFSVLFGIFCFWLSAKIIRLKFYPVKLPIVLLICLNVVLVYLYVVALRGHFTYNALRASSYEFSTTKAFNEISTNPVIAFLWVHQEYKESLKLPKIPSGAIESLEQKLFSILIQLKATKITPNIIFMSILWRVLA
ncbi:hypothetical protein [Helicobacter winghamensis]|uniref:hypothetical protein n=1 Tax=Helicobacter winghamensis TaxID=157268 RepID=UPI00351B0875